MTLTLRLTTEQERRLTASASRRGLPMEEFVVEVLDRATSEDNAHSEPFGTRLLAKWEAEGVLGLFEDCPDSPEFARELRRAAEDRTG